MFDVGSYITPDLFGDAVYLIVAQRKGNHFDVRELATDRVIIDIAVSEEHGWHKLDAEAVKAGINECKPRLVMTAHGSSFQNNVKAALRGAKIPYQTRNSSRRDSVDFIVRESQFAQARKAIDDYYAALNPDG